MDINNKQQICCLTLLITVVASATATHSSEKNIDASEELKAHWRMWYNALDTNHDGVLSYVDVETVREKLVDYHQFDETAKQQIEQWWNDCILKGQTMYPSADSFVEMLNEEYRSMGRGHFKSMIKACERTIFTIFDSNNDGFYNDEEFKIIAKVYGHEGIANEENPLQVYNPVDGKVPVEALAEAWAQFVSTEKGLNTKRQLMSEEL